MLLKNWAFPYCKALKHPHAANQYAPAIFRTGHTAFFQ
jgi:hypothetical protein